MLLSNHLTKVIQALLITAFVDIIFKSPNGTYTYFKTKCFLLLQTKLKIIFSILVINVSIKGKQKLAAADVELSGILIPISCL